MKSTAIRLLLVIGVLAVLGIAFSLVAAWRSVEMTQADPSRAASAFDLERSAFGQADPIVRFRDGGYVRRPVPPEPLPAPSSLFVLVYHRPSERLVRTEVGFWFLRMKGPASERALSGAGVDLKALGLTVADLERYGPAVVLDEERGDNRVLLWTR
jgi:hypothetical protein